MINALYCNLEVSEFKFQICNYVHFWTNTLEKGMNSLIPPDRADSYNYFLGTSQGVMVNNLD